MRKKFFQRVAKQECPKHGVFHYRIDIKIEDEKSFENFLEYVEQLSIQGLGPEELHKFEDHKKEDLQ